MLRPTLLLIGIFGMLAPTGRGAEPERPVRFREQVAPILVKRCLGCHDDRKAEGRLNMATPARLRAGGRTLGGDILVPGVPDGSYLIELVRADGQPRMPYKLAPLDPAEVATLERWVREGASFDGVPGPDTPLASLVDPLAGLPTVRVKVPATDPVPAVTFSPDGKQLAAAVGREVLLFDVAKRERMAVLKDHAGSVNAVLFTPDGKSLVAAGGRPGIDGNVIVWDLARRSRRLNFRGHADSILSAALAPDGSTLATAGYDRLVRLWDLATGAEVRTLKEHTDAVYAVAFSPDGRRLASASADRTVKLWDAATGKKLATLSGATSDLYAVVFSADGHFVLAAGTDRSIRAWSMHGEGGNLARSALAHEAAVLRLARSADGGTLYSSSEDRTVRAWDSTTLAPRATFAALPDWPLAIAPGPDASTLAVGLYDGSVRLLDGRHGRVLAVLGPTNEAPSKPELVRNPTLNPPQPRGAARGTTRRLILTGNGVGRAESVEFLEPGIAATIIPREKPDPNALDVEVTIGPEARVGVHRFTVRTPLGTPPSQPLAVAAQDEAAEAEPNDEPTRGTPVTLPTTLTGAIDRTGEVDHFSFEAKAGRPLVFDMLARPLGSALNGTLALLDGDGQVVAEAFGYETGPDPRLIATIPRDGHYRLRVADADFGGSGGHFYRIHAGALPLANSAFPLGVEAGRPFRVQLSGPNLPREWAEGDSTRTDRPPGTLLDVTSQGGPEPTLNPRRVVVAEGPQKAEGSESDGPIQLAVPGGASGRIEANGDTDLFRFDARKGESLVIEVFGRRLGNRIDPVLEVLDAPGRPIPRAVLKPVAETAVAFRDHPSAGRNIRLTKWEDFAVGDYVLAGRELLRLFELPRNPDDDAVFWGLGNARLSPGERMAFLGTTPEHHPQAQPMYKVELHPPGATFPAGGAPPVTLYYRNDDGGPGLGRDARLTFDPPADGPYLARVADARGLGGEDFGYHLVLRRPRPDFRLAVSPENPNIFRGGTAVLNVGIDRIDGFDGTVEVSVEGLPPGVTATSTTIEPGVHAAELLLMADESAPALSPPTWKLAGRAKLDGSGSEELVRTLDPGGPNAGWISVVPGPNLAINARPERVEIRPGGTVELTLAVERRNGFAGRVPIDVLNLPNGVRVQNIGLNGVLVTESQTERSVTLYAEPWARPGERSVFAVGRCEAAGTAHASRPIPLTVTPARP